MRRLPRALAAACATAAVLLAAAPARAQQPAPQTVTEISVAPGDLPVEAALDGVLQPARTRKVWYLPEAFGGHVTVVSILPSGSRVQPGQLVLELDSPELSRETERARREVEAAEAELGFLAADHAVREDEERQRLRQREEAVARAVRDQESFEKLAGPRMLAGAALGVKRAEYGLADQKEELAQLESMYQGSELASETQEIVLQRARRDVATAEAGLELTRNDEQVTRLYGHAERSRELGLAVDDRVAELAREREGIRIAQGRRDLESTRARRRVEDAREQVQRLERDRQALKVTASAAGSVTHGLEEGDLVSPRNVVFTLQDLDRLKLAAEADASFLRVLADGAAVRIVPEDFPDLGFAGVVQRIVPVGRPSEAKDKPARYPVEIALSEPQPLLRPGMRCSATITGLTLKGVLALPRRAFTTAEGKTTCKVRAGGETASRAVVLGLGDAERVHVVRGLAAGEVVVIEEGASK